MSCKMQMKMCASFTCKTKPDKNYFWKSQRDNYHYHRVHFMMMVIGAVRKIKMKNAVLLRTTLLKVNLFGSVINA